VPAGSNAVPGCGPPPRWKLPAGCDGVVGKDGASGSDAVAGWELVEGADAGGAAVCAATAAGIRQRDTTESIDWNEVSFFN
jgi:hypothetical protein